MTQKMTSVNYVDVLNAFYQSQGFPPYRWSVYDSSPWTALSKPVSKSKLALLSSGGISCTYQEPFDPYARNDLRVLEIPKDVSPADLVINDAYYDHSDADKDINCVFPIERLRELEAEGFIGELAEANYSGFMGRIYTRTAVMTERAPWLANTLKKNRVELLMLVPA